MHELSLAEELAAACREQARGRSVRQVRVRCPANIDADELSECFALVAAEDANCLKGAQLELEPVPVYMNCSCGYDGPLEATHTAGHLAVCPRCGQVGDAGTGLELVSVSFWNWVEPFGAS